MYMEKFRFRFAVILLVFLIVSSLNTQAVDFSPIFISIYLTGGDNVIRNISIVNSGSNIVTINSKTEILPEGEGINISYSSNFPITNNGKVKPGPALKIA